MSFDRWIRFVASIVSHETRRLPAGRSRLEREGDRLTLGCFIVFLILLLSLFGLVRGWFD